MNTNQISKLKMDNTECVVITYLKLMIMGICYNQISSLNKLFCKRPFAYIQNGKYTIEIKLESTEFIHPA